MPRKLPAAGYLLALIAFLLPFVEVSCNGQKVLSLTGTQLLAGTQIPGSGGIFGGPAQRIKPETSVVLAFVAGIAALVLSLLNQRRTEIAAGICGILGACSLLTLQQSIASGAPPQAMGLLHVQYEPGYFLSVVASFAGAGLSLYLAFAQRSPAAAVAPTPSPPGNPPVLQVNAAYAAQASASAPAQALPAPGPRFCTRCGQSVSADARFCAGCGAPRS